jgi:hypothetical protein
MAVAKADAFAAQSGRSSHAEVESALQGWRHFGGSAVSGDLGNSYGSSKFSGVTGWTTRNSLGSGSTEFAKYNATHSDCRDFQAAYTVSASDYVWGNFYGGDLIGASWHAGSRGWQWVSTANNGWDVLLTSVAAGTPMRGRGYSYAQNVRYVH